MIIECYCDYDYDQPEFYLRRMIKAKKRHQCEECGAPILMGEEHEYVSGKWDGYFSTFRTCSGCAELRQWVKNNVPCLYWAHGNLLEDLETSVRDAHERAREEVGGLLFGFLRRRERLYRLNRKKAVAA